MTRDLSDLSDLSCEDLSALGVEALPSLVLRWHGGEWAERPLEDVVRCATGWSRHEYDAWVLTGDPDAEDEALGAARSGCREREDRLRLS